MFDAINTFHVGGKRLALRESARGCADAAYLPVRSQSAAQLERAFGDKRSQPT
jgi:hypothetical protein